MKQHVDAGQNTRRPVLGLLMIVFLVALLAACSPSAQPAAAPVAPTQAPAPTEAPTQAPAPTEAPTQAPAPTEAPTQAPAPPVTPAQPAAVSFARDVQPILEQRCLNCHGGSDGIRGGLSMKTYNDLMKGGSDGAVIVPGDPANSLLVQLINSGEMPRRAQKLPQDQIDLIAAWVSAGAKND